MAETLNESFSSVQALAELIHGRLAPEQKDLDGFEFEEIVEDVKNAYAGVLWKVYLQTLDNGERTVIDPLLQRKRYAVTEKQTSLELEGITIIDCPRDAGISQVLAVDADNNVIGNPLVKTNAGAAYAPKSRISPGLRYYRIGEVMYFPDGLPRCSAFIEVIFLGMVNDEEVQQIPRDMADMVRDKVWAMLFPSKQIRSDITPNKNPNE